MADVEFGEHVPGHDHAERIVAEYAFCANGLRTYYDYGDGLRLRVTPEAKTWVCHTWDYRRGSGRSGEVVLGEFPAMSPQQARSARDAMRVRRRPRWPRT